MKRLLLLGAFILTSFCAIAQEKQQQTISVQTDFYTTYGDRDFDPGASASSGLPIHYTTSTPDVVTIVNNRIHIIGVGIGVVGVEQDGNDEYNSVETILNVYVNQKEIYVFYDGYGKRYGDGDPSLTFHSDELVNGDSFTGSLTRDPGENVGKYKVKQGTLSLNKNYYISFMGGDFDIHPKLIYVGAIPAKKYVGENDPELTYTADEQSVVTGTLEREPGEAPGTYTINQGTVRVTNSNYKIQGYSPATFTIEPKPIIISVIPTSKTYGDADPVFEFSNNAGLAAADFTGALERQPGKNVGTYKILQGTLAKAGYEINYEGADLTIDPKTIGVASITLKTYGTPDPDTIAYITDLPLADGDSFTGKIQRDTGENVGLHYVNQGTLALNSNYIIKFNGGFLSILKANLTIAALDTKIPQGAPIPEFDYDIKGLVNGDTRDNLVFTTPLSISVSAPPGTPAGTYDIKPYGAETANYNIEFVDGVLTVTPPIAADAALASLGLSAGTLSPSFDKNTLNYTANVSSSVTSIKLTPKAVDPAAGLKVNGVKIPNATASDPIALAVGPNKIPVEVTATDGNTKLYTVTITRAKPALSSNVSVTAVRINPGTVTRVGTTDNYTASADNTTSSATLAVGLADTNATVKINGQVLKSGVYSSPLRLIIGANIIPLEVTAQDGITKRVLTLTITRKASTNVTVTAVRTTPGTVSRVGSTDNYTSVVDNSASSATIAVGLADTGATVKINGQILKGNVNSSPVRLIVGLNTIPLEITAQDGITKRTLSLAITRKASANVTVTAVRTNPGTVSRVGTTDNYTSVVDNPVSSAALAVGLADTNATVKINGQILKSNVYSSPVPLVVGPNKFALEITAQDGVTRRTLSLTVNRKASANVSITAVSINPGALTRVGTIDTYTSVIDNTLSTTTFAVGLADTNATVKINGQVLKSGVYSPPVRLAVGVNSIPLEITAQDGVTKRIITAAVTRKAPPIGISGFKIDPGVISRVGSTDVWTSSVKADVSATTVLVSTTSGRETIKVNGAATAQNTYSAPVDLVAGSNTITVDILAEDNITKRTLTLTITRAAPPVFAMVNKYQSDIVDKGAIAQPIEVLVHQGVSPNGDGINDKFTIDGIGAYPENTVRIINRSGEVIYEAKGYDNSNNAFDGHDAKGTLQQAGTYFYSLDYKKGSQTVHKTGYIVLKY